MPRVIYPREDNSHENEQLELLNEISCPGGHIEVTVGKDETETPHRAVSFVEWDWCDSGRAARVEYDTRTGQITVKCPMDTRVNIIKTKVV